MNIFFLDQDYMKCAQQHIDRHVVKMNTEYAQMLSTCHRVVDGSEFEGKTQTGRRIKRFFLSDSVYNERLYKATHWNHPCNLWLRESSANYEWLWNMWTALLDEYTYRYGKHHKCEELVYLLMVPPSNLEDKGFTPPPLAMKAFPQCMVKNDCVQSYRNYYWVAKQAFASWKRRKTPEWWKEFQICRYNLETLARPTSTLH